MQYRIEFDEKGNARVESLDEWRFVAIWQGRSGDIRFSAEPDSIKDARELHAAELMYIPEKATPWRIENYESAREEFVELVMGLQRANGAGPYYRPSHA